MKTKKIFSALLAAIMIAMMLPMGAIFASAATAPTYAETTVALVNGAEVAADGLQAAINSSSNGGTVEIVKDFSTAGLNFQNATDAITRQWTIIGNNKTITSTASTISNSNFVLTFNGVSASVNGITLVTKASGINVKGNANVDINDCNIYSGDTKPGINAIPDARADFKGGCSIAINVEASEDAFVTVNGGVYKAYGVGGYVIQVKGNAVAYDGYFVGENTSFVGRTSHNTATTDMGAAISSLSIYGGTWIKPVINRNVSGADGTSAPDGAVLRADKGSVMNIYGGTFANFADVNKIDGANAGNQRDFILITGESSNSGFFHIFGGDFYSFMSADVNATATQLIGTFAGAVSEGNKAFAQLNFFIYGGNFYSTVPSREANVKAIAEKTALNINRISADMYTATTAENQTVTVWGKEFTGVTKWAITYNQPTEAPAGATVKVTHPDNKVYYLSDMSYTGTYSGAPAYKASALDQAVNGVAKDGSTITLLSDISIAKLNILNRNLKVTIDGASKTLTCTTNGISVCTGEITIKDLKVVSEAAGTYALKVAKNVVTENTPTIDPFELKLTVQNCEFTTASADTAIINNPVIDGTVKMTGIKVNGNAVDDIDIKYCHHVWEDKTVGTPATHSTVGSMSTECTKCQETGTRDIPIIPHEYSTYVKNDANQHKKVCSCSSDAYVLEDHDFGDWTKVDDAKHSKTCICEESVEASHAWNNGEVTTEATTEAEGVKTYTCTECGATKTEAIAKLDPPATDAPATDTPAADDATDEGGCGSAIGVGAMAVLAVAGLACGIVSKKRED